MWKIITILLILLTIFFSYTTLKKSGNAPENAGDVATSAEEFSMNFMADFKSFTGNTGDLAKYSEPIVSEKDLGELSPLYGKVRLSDNQWGANAVDANEEYVSIRALTTNTESINITGWSLQSMITGARVYIPDGVGNVVMHNVNPTYEVTVDPGQEVIISTVASPIGVSFQTNMCTGYLGQFQRFEPELDRSCPNPADIIQPTISNIQMYGSECMHLASTLQRCDYLTTSAAQSSGITVTQACLTHLQTVLTYTTCSAQYSSSTEYKNGSKWRIFLSQPNALWRSEYEVIRLLDETGRTVDVYTY